MAKLYYKYGSMGSEQVRKKWTIEKNSLLW